MHDLLGNITLRFHNSHSWEDTDLQNYARELERISTVGFMREATNAEGTFTLLNLSIRHMPNRCPAGVGFIAIGPDGHVYPCPTFYHGGQQYSIGHIRDSKAEPFGIPWDPQKCSSCKSNRCQGCPFLEVSSLPNKESICSVYEKEDTVRHSLLNRIGKSAHLFDYLRTIKTTECALKSQNEGGNSLVANRQIHDITFNDFVQSLKDIKIVIEQSANNGLTDVLNRWQRSDEIPPSSQRGIFRRRVEEILHGIMQIANINQRDDNQSKEHSVNQVKDVQIIPDGAAEQWYKHH